MRRCRGARGASGGRGDGGPSPHAAARARGRKGGRKFALTKAQVRLAAAAMRDRDTSVEEVNALLKTAAEGPLQGILGYEERPLVSADYTNDTRSGIVDAPSTMVVNGTQVKLYVWYDNEMGYAHRLVDVALMLGAAP